MKRSLSLLSLLFVIFSFIFTSHAAVLSDIEGDPNQVAIEYLYKKGVISGYPDGSFQPLKTLNRAELIKILVGGKGVLPTLEEGYASCFPDVAQEWFAPFVCYAKEQGWIAGYPDGSFQPAQEVIKVEAMKMLVNSQGYSVDTLVKELLFKDVDNTQWYAPFIKAAKERGLLEETTVYGVAEQMKRGAISENIYRAMVIMKEGLNHFEQYPAEPEVAPEPEAELEVATPVESAPTEGIVCSKDIYNCSGFSSQSEAQAMFDHCWAAVGKDIHRLDQDNNGLACESL